MSVEAQINKAVDEVVGALLAALVKQGVTQLQINSAIADIASRRGDWEITQEDIVNRVTASDD